MSYVTKMGAYGLAVVATFAVALAVLLAVSSTRTVEAGNPGDPAVHVGEIIEVSADATERGEAVTFTLDSDDENLKGVFEHSSTGTLTCQPDADAVEGATPAPAITSACDVGETVDGLTVTVRFKVGAGSDNNHSVVTADFTATTPDGPDGDTDPETASVSLTDPASPVVYAHTHSVDGNAGETVTVTFDLTSDGGHGAGGSATGAGSGDFYQIADSSIGSGTFGSNGQSAIDCEDSDKGTGCDTDKDDDEVGLKIVIADDSAKGKIIVERYERVRGMDPAFRDSIEVNVVSVGVPVATLTLKAASQSIAADGGSTTLKITMKKGNGDPASGQSVTLIATRGTFGGGNQLQKVTTNADGEATTTFNGGKVGGEATITATSGDLSKSVAITLHTGADAIAVDVDDSAVQPEGASTFVIVTVTDKDGHAVGGESPTASVKGPNRARDAGGDRPQRRSQPRRHGE